MMREFDEYYTLFVYLIVQLLYWQIKVCSLFFYLDYRYFSPQSFSGHVYFPVKEKGQKMNPMLFLAPMLLACIYRQLLCKSKNLNFSCLTTILLLIFL